MCVLIVLWCTKVSDKKRARVRYLGVRAFFENFFSLFMVPHFFFYLFLKKMYFFREE